MDDLLVAGGAGFSALDLWIPKLNEALASYPVVWLDAEMQKRGLYVTSVSGIELPHSAAGGDSLVQRARFLELCTHLDALGGGTIVVDPGAGAKGGGEGKQATSWVAPALYTCSDLAAPFEVQIAFEFQVGACSAVGTLAAAQELVQHVNRSNVGLAFGIGQLQEGGGELEDLEALDAGKLWLVRLGDVLLQSRPLHHEEGDEEETTTPSPVPTGVGRGGGHPEQQQAICRRLAAKGYRGPYCIGWLASAPADGHSLDAMVERARQARLAALEMLTPLYP
jgi:sugar phosphate isomerase/epimerase